MSITRIQAGQVWRICRYENPDRYFLVENVGVTHAGCRYLDNKARRAIQKQRMRPGYKGYERVTDPEILAQLRTQYELPAPAEVTPSPDVSDDGDTGMMEAANALARALIEFVRLAKSTA